MPASILTLSLLLAAAPQDMLPPMRVIPAGPVERQILQWQPGAVRCGDSGDPGEEIAATTVVKPYPQTLATAAPPAAITLSFDVAADGRAFNIRPAGTQRPRFDARDIMPSLRASRFATGVMQRGCRITYTPALQPLAKADLPSLARLGASPGQRLDPAAWQQMAPGNCRERPRVTPLLRAYPDRRKLAMIEGQRSWSFVRYDIDAEGQPVNPATVISSGDAALDAEVRSAVSQGRYAGGPRSGCGLMWWTPPATVAAPPIPAGGESDGNRACEIPDRWAREPVLTYPEPYRQRAIEGWAVVRYDVAPWGELGEIKVLAAEPSSEFGEAAVNVLRRARFKPLANGLTGCVDRVRFAIRDGEGDAPPGEDGPAVD
jgi:TonB family protein